MANLVDMHASFDKATADYIRAEAHRHGVSQAIVIRGAGAGRHQSNLPTNGGTQWLRK